MNYLSAARVLIAVILGSCLLGCSSDDKTAVDSSAATDLRLDASSSELGTPDAPSIDSASDTAVAKDAVLPPADGSSPDTSTPLPRLGIYTVKVDGSQLTLLSDTGSKQLTHVRPGPDGWITATRYNDDVDKNGLAMEGEGGTTPHYGRTEVVVFHRNKPQDITVIAGGVAGQLCANSSWTADGKLLYLHQDDPVTPGRSRFKRASFLTLPTVSQTEIVHVPVQVFPVDPMQWGPSDNSGMIVFPGQIAHAKGMMRPIWRMPAGGTKTFSDLQLVGCPICVADGGCCAFPASTPVLGTNDPTIHPDGTAVVWMQQHPDTVFSAGTVTIHPYRQFKKVLGQVQQQDLTQLNTASSRIQSYMKWRKDGEELAYWEIQIDLAKGVVKQPLFRMAADGSSRQEIPLPTEMCASHPSYLDNDTLIFTGWRCGGASCSCAGDKL